MASPAPTPPSPRARSWGWRLTGGLAVTALLAGAAGYHQRQVIGAFVLQSWLRDQGVEGEVVFSALGPNDLAGSLRIGPQGKPDLTVDIAQVGYTLHGPWEGRHLSADLGQIRLVRPVLKGEWRDGALHFGSLDPLIKKLTSQPQDPSRKLPDLVLEGGRLALATPFGAFDGLAAGEVKAGQLVRLDVNLEPTRAEARGLAASLSAAELHVVRKADRLLWAGDLNAEDLHSQGMVLKGAALRLTGETPYPDLQTKRADGAASLVLTSTIGDIATAATQAHNVNQTTRFSGVITDRSIKGQIQTIFSTEAVKAGKDLMLETLTGAFRGPGQASADRLALSLNGQVETRGALGKRKFSLTAPAQHLTLAIAKTFALDGAGLFKLTSEGNRADLSLARYHVSPNGITAQGRMQAEGSLGPVKDGAMALSGRLTASNGVVKVQADGCGPITAKQVMLGTNPVTDLAAEVCPSKIEVKPSGVSLEGGYRKLVVQAPSFEVALSDGEGRFSAGSPDLSFKTDVSRMKVTDIAAARRFKPVFATGTLGGSDTVFSGVFKVTDPYARALAEVKLQQAEGSGQARIDTGALTFAEGGLQPRDISPLAASLGSPVAGQVRFQGDIGWSGDQITSQGRIDIASLDFVSAAGAVKGLKGQVGLSRLLPLQAAPGQTLHVDSVASLAALTNADVKFGLDHDALQVEATGFGLAQGQVTLEPFEIPLAANAPWAVVANLKGVQLSELVEASPFADRMDLTAKVDGHIPLSFQKGTIQVAGGELHAIEPGRLSIRREALGQVAASGGPAKPIAPTEVDPYSDFAFQALENLAFTELDAKVDSQANGRLGVRFHIKGEHSPPVSPEIRLTLRELLTQKIKRTLPLPKGVKVDLSLDTSVNLDQLLDDFDKYQSLRNSASVQP